MPFLNELIADFESFTVGTSPSGAYSGGSWIRSDANRVSIVSSPVRRGTRSARISYLANDDPVVGVGGSIEWVDNRATNEDSNAEGFEAYYTTSFYLLDSDDPFGRSDHAWNGNNMWATILRTNSWELRVDKDWGDSSNLCLWLDIKGGSSQTQTKYKLIDPVSLNGWIDVMIYFLYSSSGAGKVKLWKREDEESNFTLLVDQSNINTLNPTSVLPGRRGGIFVGDKSANRTIYSHGYARFNSESGALAWFGSGTTTQSMTKPTFVRFLSDINTTVPNLHLRATTSDIDYTRTGIGIYHKTSSWTSDSPGSGTELAFAQGTGPITLEIIESPTSSFNFYAAFAVNKNNNTNSARATLTDDPWTVGVPPGTFTYQFQPFTPNSVRGSVFTVNAGSSIRWIEFYVDTRLLGPSDSISVRGGIWNWGTKALLGWTPIYQITGGPNLLGTFRTAFTTPITISNSQSILFGIQSGNAQGSGSITYRRLSGTSSSNFYFSGSGYPLTNNVDVFPTVTSEPYVMSINYNTFNPSSQALPPTALVINSVNETTSEVSMQLQLPADSNRTKWEVIRRTFSPPGSDPYEGEITIVAQGTGTSAANVNLVDRPGKSGRYYYNAYTIP